MAQHDMVIDNGPGLVVRQDMNAALAALVSTSSGPVEPQVSVAGQLWLDTSVQPNGQLKQRNLTNNGWVTPNITLGQADLWFGTRLTPDRFVWNDQANGAGGDLMILRDNGFLNIGLPDTTTGFTIDLSITSKHLTTGNALVINDKADGSGNNTILLYSSGLADFGSIVRAVGASASFRVVPTAGNGAVYWMAANGTDQRMVMYTSGGAQGNGIVAVAGQSFQFGSNGAFYVGGAYVGNNGNIVGSIWSNWGASDAYSAINARIESRAQAWAASVANNCVQSMRSAGIVEATRTSGQTNQWVEYSGYVMTAFNRIQGDQYAFRYRQPQMYIPSQGWLLALSGY